jgi:hypothetical protein
MSRGLCLSLLLWLAAGCAEERLVVADADWATVPAAQRTKVDRQFATDLAAARAEASLAAKSLAEVQRTMPAGKPSAAPAAPVKPSAAPATGDAAWTTELRSHDRARIDALAKIDEATLAWRRADLTWHQRWLEAANDRVSLVEYQHELTRGQTVDRNLVGDDTYETAPLRGQFSHAQVRWYAAADAAERARADFGRAAGNLALAKDAYAQLMRNGPGGSTADVAVAAIDQSPPPLTLPSWNVTRADIRRRHGLRHFLDEVAGTSPPPQHPLHISAALLAWQPPAETHPPAPPPAVAKPAATPAARLATSAPASPAPAAAKPASPSPTPGVTKPPASSTARPVDPSAPQPH